MEQHPPVRQIVAELLSRWKTIAAVSFGVGVVTAGLSLLLPNFYRSGATLLPETDTGKLGALGGLSDLAALAGVNVGKEAGLGRLYPHIIKSEAILRNVILRPFVLSASGDTLNLIQVYDISEQTPALEYEYALKRLREDLVVTMDNKTGVVTLSLEMKDAGLAADVINTIVGELDEFMRTKRTTNAKEQRKWIEARMDVVRDSLQQAEDALKAFREANRIVSTPSLLLRQERLLREVQLNATIFAELKKQLEIAKIEEIKNVPIINVLDAGRPAARKERPSRGTIVLSVMLLTAVATGAHFVGRRWYYRTMGTALRSWLQP